MFFAIINFQDNISDCILSEAYFQVFKTLLRSSQALAA